MNTISSISDQEDKICQEDSQSFSAAFYDNFNKPKETDSISAEEELNNSLKEEVINSIEESKEKNKFDEKSDFNHKFIEYPEDKIFVIKDKSGANQNIKSRNNNLFPQVNSLQYYNKYILELKFKVWKKKIPRNEQVNFIMKKIKAKFFKNMTKRINYLLKKNGKSKKLKNLPQDLIVKMRKENNKLILEKTLEEIILEFKQEKSSSKSIQKRVKENIELVNYLKQNLYDEKIRRIYSIFNTNIKELYEQYIWNQNFLKKQSLN